MLLRSLAVMSLAVLVVAGCGGGGGGGNTPTGPPPGPQTNSFSGTASTTGTGSCTPGAHTVATGAGAITIAVAQASAPSVKLQVCHTGVVNHATECTVPPFVTVAVGGNITATLKGGTNQVVTVFPEGCGSAGNPPASTVTYTISVTYPPG
jgi:hypothetical protein